MAHIERISRSENGYVESFNGRQCDVLLSGEIFATLREAQIVIEDGASTAIACGALIAGLQVASCALGQPSGELPPNETWQLVHSM